MLQDGLSAPIAIRIGVTGHRRLAHPDRLIDSARSVIAHLDKILSHTAHTYTVISPLAEGADRLVAQVILDWPAPEGQPPNTLIAPLPRPEADYAEDFASAGSRAQFDRLLARATERFVLSPPRTRISAYEMTGRYVVQGCDLLIAIWDGRPPRGRGGTAEIVAYAHEIGRTVIIIDPLSGKVTKQWGTDGALTRLEELDARNREAGARAMRLE